MGVTGSPYLAVLVVLQPALQVRRVGPRVEAAPLEGQQGAGGGGAGRHHRMERVVEGGGVLVGPLEYARSAGLMSTARTLARGSSAAALLGAASVSK
ncbi:hypothetical protein EYF80_055368 [Liparis tanakae]|uniref:Uncharacterized protein n=1 Tax=Liparis tanakae TaxID=230148 RepID=A0A4Z2F1E0_9TELE|nr:hypothetical protein EYF80_055368 [Liparis tanakae]